MYVYLFGFHPKTAVDWLIIKNELHRSQSFYNE